MDGAGFEAAHQIGALIAVDVGAADDVGAAGRRARTARRGGAQHYGGDEEQRPALHNSPLSGGWSVGNVLVK